MDSDRSGGCPHNRWDHSRIGPHQRIEQRDSDHDHRSIDDRGPNDHGASCDEASGNEASRNEATGNYGADDFAAYNVGPYLAAYDFAANDTRNLGHDPPDTDHLRCVIGSDIFTMRIPDAPGTVDSRFDFDAECEPMTLPCDVRGRLLRLMKDMNLVFGAIDLRMTPEGEFVFFEINPQGQFLFVEIFTGLPLSATLARYLVRNER